ncbi:cytochrome P450 [Pseudonocardia eucalypti]|uniref:Cytochrome P450 n=1 Tax=Pseudonocardia eucalypti TaxID=648755 RepID=A0ABP9PXP0_9PSEU
MPALFHAPMQTLGKARECGDIVRLHLGSERIYLLNSPEFIRRVQVTEADSFDRGRIFEKARMFVGQGLVTTDGAFHLRQRRIMQPLFHRDRVIRHVDVMRERTARMVATWRPGQRLSLDHAATDLALAILTDSIFRSDIGPATMRGVRDSLPTVNGGVLTRALLPDWWQRVPTPGNLRFARARVRLRAAVDAGIEARKASGARPDDLLSALLDARHPDSGEPMSDQQLRDEVITILMAGTETTANTLNWLFYELGRDAGIERRLHAELDSALGGRPVTADDLARLPYLERVIDETTRLYSPVWFLMRRLTAPVDFGGVRLPVGAQVVYSSTALHRDPGIFPDPMRFDPDRWDPERSGRTPRAAFIPFAAGRHRCLGESFAKAEMAVVVATIAAEWRLCHGRRRLRERALGTLRPSTLHFTARPRTRPIC